MPNSLSCKLLFLPFLMGLALVACDQNQTPVQVFDSASYHAPGYVSFSPTEDHIVMINKVPDEKTEGHNEIAQVMDLNTGRILFRLQHGSSIGALEYSPDGNLIITTGEDPSHEVKLWDAHTGQLVKSLIGHTDNVISATFSPTGDRIVSVSADGLAKLWTGPEWTLLASYPIHQHRRIVHATFSKNGLQVLTSGDDGFYRIWNAIDGSVTFSLDYLRGGYDLIEFSPNFDLLFTSIFDKAKVTRVADKQTVSAWEWPVGFTNSVTFSPDGSKILSSMESGLSYVFEASTGKQLFVLYGTHTSYSKDGSKIISTNVPGVSFWDAQTGVRLDTRAKGDLNDPNFGLTHPLISDDGRWALSVFDAAQTKIYIWKI